MNIVIERQEPLKVKELAHLLSCFPSDMEIILSGEAGPLNVVLQQHIWDRKDGPFDVYKPVLRLGRS